MITPTVKALSLSPSFPDGDPGGSRLARTPLAVRFFAPKRTSQILAPRVVDGLGRKSGFTFRRTAVNRLQQPDDEFLLPNRRDLCIPGNADFRQRRAEILL